MIIYFLVYFYFLKFLCCKYFRRKDDVLVVFEELEVVVVEVCKYDDKLVVYFILGILYEEDKCFDEVIC